MMRMWMWMWLWLVALAVLPAWAGQMGGHTYVALQARGFLSGSARAAVEANEEAYLSGAQGPDICGVVMPGLNKASFFTAVGGETHYSDKKAELALNLLDCATNDAERAYALGWMTHYANDIFVHAVVNDYGGYYAVDDKRHKVLEQLEQKHVLAKYGAIVTPTLSKTVPQTIAPTFGGFIFDAYHKTYPDNKIYQQGNEWFVANRPYFCDRYKEAVLWCRAANERFLESHTSGTGDHGWSLAGLPFPAMPSQAAYTAMAKAIEITKLEAEASGIRVTVKVNDNRLFGRFLVDWDREIQPATQYMQQVFTLASAYLAAKDPKAKAAVRQELLAVIPNVNLDQPHAAFDHVTAKPGNLTVNQLTWRLTLHKGIKQGAPLPKPDVSNGQSAPITFTGKSFSDMQSGEVTFTVPVPAGAAPYHFTLQLALSGPEAFAVPAYRDVDWTQADGDFPGTWMSGAGSVMVTDLFTVRLPLSDTMVGKPGTRRWVLMPPGSVLLEEDLPLIKARLPHEKFRYDIEAVEEQVEGRELTATLQVTNANPFAQKISGPCRLLMLWFTEGKADTDVGGALDELNAQLEAANKLMEEYDALMAKLITPEQQAHLEEVLGAYAGELLEKHVADEEMTRLMAQRSAEEMAKMKIDLTPLNVLNAKIEALNAMGALPFHVATDMALAPVELNFDTAAEWQAAADWAGETKGRSTRSASVELKRQDEKGRQQWNAGGDLTVELLNDLETIKAAEARIQGGETLTMAGFTGVLKTTSSQGPENGTEIYRLRGEGVLKKGRVALHITYDATAQGYKIYENQPQPDGNAKLVLVYDGREDAGKAAARLLADITGMYRGVRLLPGR